MIQEYELEVKLIDKRNGASEMITCTEYAYQIADVPSQAIYSIMREREMENFEMKILRLGPPKRLVELAAKRMAVEIETLLNRLTKASKE